MYPRSNLSAIVLACLLAAGCLAAPAEPGSPLAQDPVGPLAAMMIQGSPEGTASVFEWKIPPGTTVGPNPDGYYTMPFSFWLRADGPEGVLEWAFFVFDQFQEGPAVGQWRPQAFFLMPKTRLLEGTPRLAPGAEPEFQFAGEDVLFNRSSFDGRTLRVLVLLKTDVVMDASLVLRATHEETSPPLDAKVAAGAPSAQPRATAKRFALSWFSQYNYAGANAVRHSTNVEVRRVTDATAMDILDVSTRHHSPQGWVFATAFLGGWTRAGDFELRASYRGKTLEGSGPFSDGPTTSFGGLRNLTHYVYCDGLGANRFDLRMGYLSVPGPDSLQYYRVEMDTRLDTLMAASTFQHWKVRANPEPENGCGAGAA